MKILHTLSVLLVLAGSFPLFAETRHISRGQEVVVVYDPVLADAARQVVQVFPTIQEELADIFGWSFQIKPTVALIRDGDRFQTLSGNPAYVAYALPSKNAMVLDYSRIGMHPFSMHNILKHELCHLWLHRQIAEQNLPRWLEEGICQWASDGIAEILLDRRRPILKQSLAGGSLIPLRHLEVHFPEDRHTLALAYEQSQNLVDYINRQYGKKALLTIIGFLKKGDPIETAVASSLHISLNELEEQWLDHVRKNQNWWTLAATNVYSILFFLAAVVTAIGGAVKLVRKKKMRADTLEDDPRC